MFKKLKSEALIWPPEDHSHITINPNCCLTIKCFFIYLYEHENEKMNTRFLFYRKMFPA